MLLELSLSVPLVVLQSQASLDGEYTGILVFHLTHELREYSPSPYVNLKKLKNTTTIVLS